MGGRLESYLITEILISVHTSSLEVVYHKPAHAPPPPTLQYRSIYITLKHARFLSLS
jgi:hypothetical protein